MKKSEFILPLPIYDDLFDQQRFNFHSYKTEQLGIAFPTNQLPFFQFGRDKKLELPDKFYLKNVCNDNTANFYKSVPEPATIFSNYAATEFYGAFPKTVAAIFDDHTGHPVGTTWPIVSLVPCGIANTPGDFSDYTIAHGADYAQYTLPIVDNKYNRFRIIVDKFKRTIGSTFSIKVYHGNTLFATITAAGTYEYEFFASSNELKVVFDAFVAGDQFQISYNQAWVTNPLDYGSYATDIQLDQTKLKVVPMKDGTDRIIYCEANQNYIVPPGDYYYIVSSGRDVYFSEVFCVISIKDSENYYRLKWWNSCDINNAVIYRQSVLACNYNNYLYLEASLFKPEPESKADTTENGLGELNVNFSSWKKNINLEITKSPEFLTDALSAIFMHDNIFIAKPLNIKQESTPTDIRVKRVVPDVSSVLNDYYQKVNLKLLLKELYTGTGCCTEADVYPCTPNQYTASLDPCDPDSPTGYYLKLSGPPEAGDGLIDCATGNLVDLQNDTLIKVGSAYYNLILIDGIWNVNTKAPVAANLGESPTGVYQLYGFVLPNSFAVIEYKLNGGAWTVQINQGTGDSGEFNMLFDTRFLGTITDLKVRVRSKTLNCDFGTTDEIEIV